MARALCTFGVVVLLAAFALQLISSISTPFLTDLDIVRVHFNKGVVSVNQIRSVSEIRLGVWGYCTAEQDGGDFSCEHTGHGYSIGLHGPENAQVANIQASWTNGLAVHPVATAVIFVAFVLSFSTHLLVALITTLVAFLAALITLIAFAIDIALYALTKHAVHDLDGVSANVNFGPGYWLTLATVVLVLLGGCTTCFGRHRARRAGTAKAASATMTTDGEKSRFWRRWRRNKV
ncbi:pali-domain-containing protein [Hysterangium stoloniferum]|nr:pali-domain-containing protein [Hysterangium stoloniferum]